MIQSSFLSLAGIVFLAGLSSAQTTLTFEVATIKPAPPLTSIAAQLQSGKLHIGMQVDASRVDIGNLSLSDLICLAYKIKQHQLSGPSWMSTERFDILAKMPQGATKEQVPEMLQALLAERFQLTVHKAGKEQSVYGLVVGKGGAKLKESAPDPVPATDDPAAGGPNGVRVSQTGEGKGVTISGGAQHGATRMTTGANGTMHIESTKMPLPGFADMLSRFVDRPVVDMTELKGAYDVALDLSIDDIRNVAQKVGVAIPGAPVGGGAASSAAGPADSAADPSSNSIFNSVQALGLKLEPRKSLVDIIVVDRLEKTPTEN